MSMVAELILNADSEARYLGPKEINIFQNFLSSGEKRMRIARFLAENESQIVQTALTNSGNVVL